MSYLRKIRAIGNFFGLSIFRKKMVNFVFYFGPLVNVRKNLAQKKNLLIKKKIFGKIPYHVSAFCVSGLLEDQNWNTLKLRW